MTEPRCSPGTEHVLVPHEPTREMLEAGANAAVGRTAVHHDIVVEAVYRAMIGAAPVGVAQPAHTPASPETVQSVGDLIEIIESAYAFDSDDGELIDCPEWQSLKAAVASHPSAKSSSEHRMPLADHDEITRKVANQPQVIQNAIITIAAHCTVLTDDLKASLGSAMIADLAGCISQNCLALANALAAPDGSVAQSPNRDKIYGILYEQLDLSVEVIIELAECGNLGDVTDAVIASMVSSAQENHAEKIEEGQS